MKKHEPLTMYKNNSRDSSKFKGCSPLQLFYNLTGKCHAVGYYSYTNRCMPCKKKATAQIAHLVFADTKANAKKPKELFYCQTHID